MLIFLCLANNESGLMKNYLTTGILTLLFSAPVVIAAPTDFCPAGGQCTLVWEMKDSAPPSYDGHGLSWIVCNPTESIQFGNQTLVVKYQHNPGDIEQTCYARYDLSSYFKQTHLTSHGYLTATITISGTQDKNFLDRIWPALWVRGVGAWPVNGEIDMFEYMGSVQEHRTHVNLHGAPVANQDYPKSEVVTYNKAKALEDIGQTHTYGMEWKKDQANGYMLTFYIDNVIQGNYYASPASSDLLDAAIIRGFTAGMQLVFDIDDVGSNGANIDIVKKLPTLNYQLEATNVKLFSVK